MKVLNPGMEKQESSYCLKVIIKLYTALIELIKRERDMFQNKNAVSKSPNNPRLCQHVMLCRSTGDE